MPTGKFQIGDLEFSYDGDLEELAHCQEIIREIRQAEYRLQRAASAEKVHLIYDRGLQGDHGTFDKMRLRSYDGPRNYTIDIGVTDNNPLGIYVGYDENIKVYDRETEDRWEIDPDGNRVGGGPSPSSTGEDGGSSSGTPPTGSPGPQARQAATHPSPEKIKDSARALIKMIGDAGATADQKAKALELPGGNTLEEKIEGLIEYAGRSDADVDQVLKGVGTTSIGELTAEEATEAITLIASGATPENEKT